MASATSPGGVVRTQVHVTPATTVSSKVAADGATMFIRLAHGTGQLELFGDPDVMVALLAAMADEIEEAR